MPSEAPSDVSDSATLTKVHGWDEKNKMSLIRYVGYWPSVRSIWLDIGQVLCCVFMEAEVHKLAKKERGQYPAILTEQAWSIEDLCMAFGKIFLAGYSGQSRAAVIFPARVANHSARFGPSCPLTELAI